MEVQKTEVDMTDSGDDVIGIDTLPTTEDAGVQHQVDNLRDKFKLQQLAQTIMVIGRLLHIANLAMAKEAAILIKAQNALFDVLKLCDTSSLLLQNFQNGANNILEKLKIAYLYLLEGYEDYARTDIEATKKDVKAMRDAVGKTKKGLDHCTEMVVGVGAEVAALWTERLPETDATDANPRNMALEDNNISTDLSRSSQQGTCSRPDYVLFRELKLLTGYLLISVWVIIVAVAIGMGNASATWWPMLNNHISPMAIGALVFSAIHTLVVFIVFLSVKQLARRNKKMLWELFNVYIVLTESLACVALLLLELFLDSYVWFTLAVEFVLTLQFIYLIRFALVLKGEMSQAGPPVSSVQSVKHLNLRVINLEGVTMFPQYAVVVLMLFSVLSLFFETLCIANVSVSPHFNTFAGTFPPMIFPTLVFLVLKTFFLLCLYTTRVNVEDSVGMKFSMLVPKVDHSLYLLRVSLAPFLLALFQLFLCVVTTDTPIVAAAGGTVLFTEIMGMFLDLCFVMHKNKLGHGQFFTNPNPESEMTVSEGVTDLEDGNRETRNAPTETPTVENLEELELTMVVLETVQDNIRVASALIGDIMPILEQWLLECTGVLEPTMDENIRTAEGLSVEEKKTYWQSVAFKTEVIGYYCRWRALQVYAEDVRPKIRMARAKIEEFYTANPLPHEGVELAWRMAAEESEEGIAKVVEKHTETIDRDESM